MLISHNSPNPFNLSTDIIFSLPAETDIRINIYNLAGALISSVEIGTLNAGSHEYSWNAGKLPRGIYFYSIRGTDINGTGKMLLLK